MNRPASTLGNTVGHGMPQAQGLPIDQGLLWRVTLGFLPAFANFQKRLTTIIEDDDDEPPPPPPQQQQTKKGLMMPCTKTEEDGLFSIEVVLRGGRSSTSDDDDDDVPDAEAMSECSMGSGWSSSSSTVTSYATLDGNNHHQTRNKDDDVSWRNHPSDEGTATMRSCSNSVGGISINLANNKSNDDDRCQLSTTSTNYSGSFYDFARTPSSNCRRMATRKKKNNNKDSFGMH